MNKDKFETLGPLYAELGGELAKIVGGNPDGTFVYAEAGEGWLGASVFKDDGDLVRYFDPSARICQLLRRAREFENPEPKMRWSVMKYGINGTTFVTNFAYPDEVEVESFDLDRREAALKEHFGNKPVIYPPPPNLQP